MKQQVQFFCYGSRPKHVDLDPLPHAIYVTLRDSRGIMARGGLDARVIRNALVRGGDAWAEVITELMVLTELRKLKGLGLVEQLASAPERWRVKR